MPGGIFKKGSAQEAQAVQLGSPGATQTEPPGGVGQPEQADAPAAPRPAVRPPTQDYVRREAQSAAARIKAEAEEHAAELIAQAAEAAEALKSKAEVDAARKLESAESAIAQREEQLRQQIRSELNKEYQERYLKALQALEGAAAEIAAHQAEYLAAIEQPAFELVLAIARQALGRELADAQRSLPALIARAFQLLQPQQPLTVFVGPAAFQQLSDSALFADALTQAGVRPERIELEIDSALGEGQFRAESGGSSVVCDLPALLDEITGHLSSQARLEPSSGADAQ